MAKQPFGIRLTNWRNRNRLTNGEAALRLTQLVGFAINTRTLEGWIQGRDPHSAVQRLVLREIGGEKSA